MPLNGSGMVRSVFGRTGDLVQLKTARKGFLPENSVDMGPKRDILGDRFICCAFILHLTIPSIVGAQEIQATTPDLKVKVNWAEFTGDMQL